LEEPVGGQIRMPSVETQGEAELEEAQLQAKYAAIARSDGHAR